jgi:hypothetical protein
MSSGPGADSVGAAQAAVHCVLLKRGAVMR